MRFSIKSTFLQLAVAFTALLLIQACSDDKISGPDFSTVPPPFDISQPDSTFTKDGGVEIIIVKEGNKQFEVITRDIIEVKFTGRTIDGEIFQSTYSDGNKQPQTLGRLLPTSTQSALVEGFRRGLLGMTKGEKRVIIVPPSLGYDQHRRNGINGFDLRGDSLRYDIELVSFQ